MISSKKKVLENYDCDDDNYDNNEKNDDIRNDSNDVFIAAIFMRLTRKIMTKSSIIMTRTVITLMLTTLMILIAVIRIIMNIENDNDNKKIQLPLTIISPTHLGSIERSNQFVLVNFFYKQELIQVKFW